MAGVHALASLSPALHNPEASLLPDLADVRSVSVHVAAAVVRQAVEDENATDDETIAIVKGNGPQGLEDYIKVSSVLAHLDAESGGLKADFAAEPNVGRRLPTTTTRGLGFSSQVYAEYNKPSYRRSTLSTLIGPGSHHYTCTVT